MANWGNTDDAANSVDWAVSQLNRPANTANRAALYGNTTMGAFEAGEVNAQVGLDDSEAAAAPGSHAGWNLQTTGTGSLATLTISAGGTAYANADTIEVAATGTGSVNATATLTTNATGGITAVTITNAGAGFTTTNPTAVITTGTGSAATLVATAGGRAGRVQYETLVAMGSIT